MKLTFLGGADEVGASCTLIEVAEKRILVDAGIRISPKTARGIEPSQLPDLQPISAIGGVDFILVTHAHTDHTGALPLILGQFPNTPVFMTQPTEALVQVLQKDAQNIMKDNYETEGELPLFDDVSVDRLMNAITTVPFNQPIKLGEGLQVTYRVSGHIVGAAMLIIESVEGTLVMSGDVSKSSQRTVKSIDVPRIKANVLVLESTYGGRLHANREAEERRIVESLKRVTERGGKVLIPAFALGRAQEVIQIILAYRDQISVPVYVDGMVRKVCDAYSRFQEYLPEEMAKRANGEHLFFRRNIHPVKSTQHRFQIANSTTPCIVVASSGMLTGGASQYYATQFVPDELNAIFITGYQDEESPGKFLQRIVAQRQEKEEVTIRLGKATVQVRCEIGTYSLSAHADEDELVSITKALGAQEVLLVHGDAAARHSLASALRQREINVINPRVGTSHEFTFTHRAWALATSNRGIGQGKDFSPRLLWESVKGQAGNYFSSRELAIIWWGDGERAKEIEASLRNESGLYFTSDWRNQTTFLIHSEDQVKRALRQRAVMMANPDIIGKLVMVRDASEKAYLAVVKNADIASFEAIAEGTKSSFFPADFLVWVLGQWTGYNPSTSNEKHSIKSQLSEMADDARSLIALLLPNEIRKELVELGSAIHPASLISLPLPDGVSEQLALTSIVFALAEDECTVEQEGLLPHRLFEVGPMEMNKARLFALDFFPEETRLRKVGMDMAQHQLMLSFDFPHLIKQNYNEMLEELERRTSWTVVVKETVSYEALASAVYPLLPPEMRMPKDPVILPATKEVKLSIPPIENAEAIIDTYKEFTGYTLVFQGKPDTVPTGAVSSKKAKSEIKQMEINEAYAFLKNKLDETGILKMGFHGDHILLTYISPQVGERHQELISEIEPIVGYSLRISSSVNQQKILLMARQFVEGMGWNIRKSPSIFLHTSSVSVTLMSQPAQEAINVLAQRFADETGFTLIIQ